MAAKPTRSTEPTYSIASVARLTGIDPHTVRAWERRHGAVAPRRTPSGQRRYDDAAVARLQLLKAVIDAGEPIGQIARLSEAALQARLEKLTAERSPASAEAVRSVALLAPSLVQQIEADATARAGLHVLVSADDLRGLIAALGKQPVDVVVAELPSLGAEPLRAVRAILDTTRPRLVLIVYQFASAPELARLRRLGVRLVRGPLRASALRQTIRDLVASKPAEPAPRRRAAARSAPGESGPARLFDDRRLARLLETPSGLSCECPSHLASLVSSVGAFERYSRDCESRSPEDAVLHRALADGSARVRVELERMLLRLCEHEGLTI